MTTSQIYELSLYILTSLAIIVAARDVILKKRGKWYKRVSLWGWSLIAIAIGIFVFSLLKSNSDNDEKASIKKHSDSVINKASEKLAHNVDSALHAHNLTYNPVTKTITIIDTTQRKPIDPVMDIIVDSVKFIGTLRKSFISILFATINNGIAYNPRCEFLIFAVYDNKIIGQGPKINADNSLIKSYGIHGYKYASQVELPKKPVVTDTSYIFFKALYSNKEINGKDQPPLRGLFYVTLDTIPKSVSEIKIHPISGTDKRHELQKILIQNKYW